MSDKKTKFKRFLRNFKKENTSIKNLIDRISYFFLGAFYRNKKDKYSKLDRALDQSRITVSYDTYMSRIVFISLIVSIIGGVFGLISSIIFSNILINFNLGITFPEVIYNMIKENKYLLLIVFITTIFIIVSFISVYLPLYYYPYYIANERERKIDKMLPHAVTFMYAMSRGGVNVLGVMKAIANAEDVYGEVSKEFQAIVHNIEYMNKDIRTSITEESNKTPSDNFGEFLEDMLSVIDTGSDMESFFLNKSELYLNRSKEKQDKLLDTLEIISESYVTVFVATPIFLLIMLVVMSMLGGNYVKHLYVLTYIGIPFGGILYTFLIKLISGGGNNSNNQLNYNHMSSTNFSINWEELEQDERYHSYKRFKRKNKIRKLPKILYQKVKEKPYYSFIITIPLSLLYLTWLHFSPIASLTYDAFLQTPEWQTVTVIYIPTLIILGTYSLLFEIKRRREKRILKRLPELFKSTSDANERGLDIEESFKVVSKNSKGKLASELQKSINQAFWTGNLNKALINFANRIKVPRLSRTMKLITKANEVSGDLRSVLQVAAKDVQNMYELDIKRRQNGLQYLAIIFVSFLVSIGVILMLDSAFLSSIKSTGALTGSGNGSIGGTGMGGGKLPIKKFRLAFIHLTFLLGLASGTVAGVMADNNASSGIKFGLLMSTISLTVFILF